MAKVKNKRNAGLADKVHGKRKAEATKKKLNPFEVHINKEKLKVLGKKTKHDRGLPGVSRAKAVQKRKETLGTEMKLMNKTNTFIDRRIGEKDSQLTAEDRMVARFAAERVKQHGKKNIFNLADDEILTHRGQTLEQIEKFDDPRSSDDEDDEGLRKKFGGLGDEFVAEGHFGGGMLSKADADGAKSHKDLIEQLITESKKRKAEKQKEKEQTLDLTEKLDSEWKDLQPVVFKRARLEEKENGESLIDKLLSEGEKKNADYDKMMRELRFDRRGTPLDGLKNEEKQAKEEKKRLEQLERDRQERMVGESNTAVSRLSQPTAKHRSADDLDDNFELDDEKQFMLAYDNEGKPLVPEHVLKDYSVPNAKPKFEDGISDTSSNEDSSDEESDDDDNEITEKDKSNEIQQSAEDTEESGDECEKLIKQKDKLSDLNKDNHIKESDVESDSGEESGDKCKKLIKRKNKQLKTKIDTEENNTDNLIRELDDENDSEQDSSDENKELTGSNKSPQTKLVLNNKQVETNKIETSNSEIITEELDKKIKNNACTKEDNRKKNESNAESGDDSDDESDNEKQEIDNLYDLKKSDEESDEEIEATDTEKIESFFELSSSEEDNLKELLAEKMPSQQFTALQKLINNYDPSLAESNKDKLSRLYAHMLQYIHDTFTNLENEGDVIKAFLVFDKIAPLFYDLSHTNKVSSKKFLAELLKEKHDKFQKNPRKVPDMNTLIFFKLVSLLYPTSDFRHPITTPSLVFMSEILTLSKFNDAYSITRGLFLVSMILEYTSLSKRFVPSAINFLRGILYLSANTTVLNPIQVVPPFKFHKGAKLLNLENDCTKMAVEHKMAAKDLVLNQIDDDFKIRSLLTTSFLLEEFFNDSNDIEAQDCIFRPHLQLFGRIDLQLYPKNVKKIVQNIVKQMKASLEVKTYTHLAREKKKPKALRLYEPDVQEVFTGSKSSKLSREQAERARLQMKVKKEMKGALREIRRDKAYIASVKIRQKIQSDNLRKEKVKQIYKDASIQQGELNQLKRMK